MFPGFIGEKHFSAFSLMSIRLHAALHGDGGGVPLVMVHGFLGSGRDWLPTVDVFGRERKCLLLDLPGHGESIGLADSMYRFEGAVCAVVDVIRRSCPDGCSLLGYSLGGRLALGAALQAPELIHQLLLESSAAGLEGQGKRAARRKLDAQRAAALREEPFEAFLAAWYGQILFSTLARKRGRVSAMVKSRQDNDPLELARVVEGLSPGRQPVYWEDLDRLDVPVTCIAGAEDEVYVTHARRMAACCPRGRAIIVAGAGHVVHLEETQAFITAVLSTG